LSHHNDKRPRSVSALLGLLFFDCYKNLLRLFAARLVAFALAFTELL
jgi:hypothetical protein